MSHTNVTEKLGELISEFAAVPLSERLEYLVELGDELPDPPALFNAEPQLLERVEECQSPVYFALTTTPAPQSLEAYEVSLSPEQLVQLIITVPESAPATRGFASVLEDVISAIPCAQVHDIPEDLPQQLGLGQLITPLRLRGMSALIVRVQRQATEKTSPTPGKP